MAWHDTIRHDMTRHSVARQVTKRLVGLARDPMEILFRLASGTDVPRDSFKDVVLLVVVA